MVTMGELVEDFMHHVSELQVDISIIMAADGEEPITTNAIVGYNVTRRKALNTIDTMMRVQDPVEKEKVKRIKDRFLDKYPEDYKK